MAPRRLLRWRSWQAHIFASISSGASPRRLRLSRSRHSAASKAIHHSHQLGVRERLPAVWLHRTAVLEGEVRFRVVELRRLLLHQIDAEIEIVVVHVADVDVHLAGERRSDARPVLAEIPREIVAMVAPI